MTIQTQTASDPRGTLGFRWAVIRAMQLAKVAKQPVPSMPANMEATTKMPMKSPTEAPAMALKKAPVKAQQPTGEEVEVVQVFTTPPQLVAQNAAPASLVACRRVTITACAGTRGR